MSIYSNVATVKVNNIKDKEGFIRAALVDLPNEHYGDFEYDRWLTLIGIIKYEIEDIDKGFEIFDEFSSRAEHYDPDVTYKKYYDSQVEGNGTATIGSLIFWLKELDKDFDFSKYSEFYGTEKVSSVKHMAEKIAKSKNELPTHVLTEEIQQLKLPNVSVPAELALTILLSPGKKYATATHPAQEYLADPYAGDELLQYISVNPMKGTRSQDNCEDFRHAVVEFDSISLDEQFSVLSAVDLPYEALVFTGNKSIHAWIRIDAPDLETYKKRTRLINKMFEDFGYSKKTGKKVDTAVLYDPSSWVRCPGVERTAIKDSDKSTGQIQKVIWTEQSKGWDFWYNNVYPQYVVESSLMEAEEEFEVPAKDLRFTRKLKQVTDGLGGDDFKKEFKSILEGLSHDEVQDTLNEAITSFLQHVRKKAKIRVSLTKADLYHIFEETVVGAGTLYEGDIREALLISCRLAEHFEDERKRQYKEKLEADVDSIKGKINKWVDPELVIEIDKQLEYAKDQGEAEYSEVLKSVEELFEDLDFRTAVLKKPELYKYAKMAGELLSAEFKENRKGQETDDIFYVYYEDLQTFDRENSRFEKVTTYTFPSVVTPYICFVQKDQKGRFKAVPLDDNSVAKLLASPQFLSSFKKVEVVSDVPVFHEEDGKVSLIKGYNAKKNILVVGSREGFDFMELEKAKEVIIDLFKDFKFVCQADLSRAIACLLMPAMCHSDLLRGDSRPIAYVDADSAGAGKGTMIHFLTCPYVDSPGMVTQDDASIGSIDEKIASYLKTGNNHVVLDNLKPTRKMRELSSPFIEAMMTSDRMSFRCAGERMSDLDLRWACLYVTTNGMQLSKDTAERSLYISIRKQDADYQYRQYETGLKNWLIERRPLIMSAIFSVLKEYVERGKPLKRTVDNHRFIYSVPAVNYIVSEIFGLPDVTTGLRLRNDQKSAQGIDIIRTLCFCVDKAGLLGEQLTHIDMFELLASDGKEDILELGYDIELYTDESGTTLTSDAKRKIGTKLGMLFSRPKLLGKQSKDQQNSCQIEEFVISRIYEPHKKTPYYIIEKEEPKL